MSASLTLLRRLLLLLIASVLAWRLISLRMAEYYIDQGGQDAADKALAWQGQHPRGLVLKGAEVLEKNPELAEQRLREAYRANPASADPLLVFMDLEKQRGNTQQATALAEHAVVLMPARAKVHQIIAGYWVGEDNLPAALEHWSRAMTADSQTRKTLLPVLLRVAESPRRNDLKPLALSAPPWWESFFALATRQALDLDTVRALYAFRLASTEAPVSDQEKDAYVRRLQRDGQTAEAYLAWLNRLSAPEQEQLGLLYNGSFELEPTNTGFDWHWSQQDNLAVKTAGTYGIHGSKALRLLFKRREKPTWNAIRQPLFLDPGHYRVSGMVRTDGLDSIGGLKWVVLCQSGEIRNLGESERFLGSSEWRDFRFEVQVPEDCPIHELRLMTAGRRDFEHKISGGIWFDKLAIRKLRAEEVPPMAASGSTLEGTLEKGRVQIPEEMAAEREEDDAMETLPPVGEDGGTETPPVEAEGLEAPMEQRTEFLPEKQK